MALGQQLREARRRRNLTASQVAAGTRMKVQMVEAIENEDFRCMAAPIYAKGFIRMYAEFVGLDARPLIDEYMASGATAHPPSLISQAPARAAQSHEQEAVKRHQQEYGVCDEFVVHSKETAAPAPEPAAEPPPAPPPPEDEPDLFSRAPTPPPEPVSGGPDAAPTFEELPVPSVAKPEGPVWTDRAVEVYGDVRDVVSRLSARVKDRRPGGSTVSPRVIAVAVVLLVVLIFLFSGLKRWREKPAPPAPPPHAQKGEALRLAVPVPDPYVD